MSGELNHFSYKQYLALWKLCIVYFSSTNNIITLYTFYYLIFWEYWQYLSRWNLYNNTENCILLSEMHPGRCRHIVGNATKIFGFEWSRLVFIHNNAFFVLKICIPIDLGGLKNNIPNFHPTTILMFAAPLF